MFEVNLEIKKRYRIRRSRGEFVFDSFNTLLMLLVVFIMAFPFWYCIVYSLNESFDAKMGGLWIWPRIFTTRNYKYVFLNPDLWRAYLVTIVRTVVGSASHLVVTGFAAYALSKRHVPGYRFLTLYFVIPMFIGGTIVSNYVVIAKYGLLNNFLVYILPGLFSFFNMAIIRAFIEELPISLEESAKMDGAGYFRIFFRIIVPLCMPIIATVLIFSAVGHWLDFYTNLLYVTKKILYTLQYILYRIMRSGNTGTSGDLTSSLQGSPALSLALAKEQISTETLKMTTLIVITMPILFIYPFFQKYIIKGVLLGSIKG